MSMNTALKHIAYALRGKLKNAFLVVCAFAAFGGVSALAQTPVKTTIKVCVADESGPAVDAKLTLVNAPGKIYRQDGSCYKTDELPLNPGQVYFIVATTAEQKFASAPLVVQPDDKGKEIPVSLRLQKLDASSTTAIEICLKDKSDLSIPIKDISLSGDSNQKTESSSEQDCSRLIVPQAADYKLTVHSDPVATTVSSVGFGAGHYFLLFLAILSLGGVGLVFLRVYQLPRDTARQRNVDQISTDLGKLLQNTSKLEQIITAWRKEGGGTSTEKPDTDGGNFFFKDELGLQGLNVEEIASVLNPLVETIGTPPETHLTSSGRAYARQQYSSFSQGECVDHFFLMPSGSSSASDMVDGAKIALREQKQGSYVAFRSIENENEAWVFPMPHRDFTPEAFNALFPHLTAQQYESGDIDPKTAIITEPKLWKLQD
jgi:hypothetical protein